MDIPQVLSEQQRYRDQAHNNTCKPATVAVKREDIFIHTPITHQNAYMSATHGCPPKKTKNNLQQPQTFECLSPFAPRHNFNN